LRANYAVFDGPPSTLLAALHSPRRTDPEISIRTVCGPMIGAFYANYRTNYIPTAVNQRLNLVGDWLAGARRKHPLRQGQYCDANRTHPFGADYYLEAVTWRKYAPTQSLPPGADRLIPIQSGPWAMGRMTAARSSAPRYTLEPRSPPVSRNANAQAYGRMAWHLVVDWSAVNQPLILNGSATQESIFQNQLTSLFSHYSTIKEPFLPIDRTSAVSQPFLRQGSMAAPTNNPGQARQELARGY